MARNLIVRSVDHHASNLTKATLPWDKTFSGVSVESSGFLDGSFWDEAGMPETQTHQSDLTFVQADDTKACIETQPEVDESSELQVTDDGTFPTRGEAIAEKTAYSSAPFSYRVFQKAIEICLAAEDFRGGRDVLEALVRLKNVYPKEIQSEIWSFALTGFARFTHSESVKELFEAMKNEGMTISEESYGAVMHSLATANQPDEVSQMFQELREGKLDAGVAPGISCYNALILSYLNKREWHAVLTTYEDLKSAGVVPDSATIQGLLISSYRKGDSAQVRGIIEELVAMDVVISQENCHLALKMLLPEIAEGKRSISVDTIQQRLRELGSNNDCLRPASLKLLRSFRQADIEQRRLPTKNTPIDMLSKRREEAWQTTLRDILEIEDAIATSSAPELFPATGS